MYFLLCELTTPLLPKTPSISIRNSCKFFCFCSRLRYLNVSNSVSNSVFVKQHGNGNAYDLIKKTCFMQIFLFSDAFFFHFFGFVLNCPFKFHHRTWCSSLHHFNSAPMKRDAKRERDREEYFACFTCCYTYLTEIKCNFKTLSSKRNVNIKELQHNGSISNNNAVSANALMQMRYHSLIN